MGGILGKKPKSVKMAAPPPVPEPPPEAEIQEEGKEAAIKRVRRRRGFRRQILTGALAPEGESKLA